MNFAPRSAGRGDRGPAPGIAAVAALWWAYFDIVAIVAERRLIEAPPGRAGASGARRDSYLHFPMIAGIVLLAVGLRETLAHVSEPLDTVPADRALCERTALYLAGAHRIPPQDRSAPSAPTAPSPPWPCWR